MAAGVALDAKSLANSYDIPFVSFGGRDNNGKILIYFMGFFPNERSESMSWFVRCFKEFVAVCPRVVSCDQDAAIHCAVKENMPTSLIFLDEWHLNRNQLKNSGMEAGRSKGKFKMDDLNAKLHDLRKSVTREAFKSKRREIERSFFASGDLPKWFTGLYYTKPEMVVKCFKKCHAVKVSFFRVLPTLNP